MDKSKTIREILENLCHNTMGNPPYRIDQALSQIKKELLEKLPKEKAVLSITTVDNPNLFSLQQETNGFNDCLSQVKKIIEEA
jgi:hypothetical protein